MYRFVFSLLAAGFVLLAPNAIAQSSATPTASAAASGHPNYLLQGQVLDAEGLPLPGATVMVKGTKQVFVTNAEGYYAISTSLPASVLLISLAGYSDAALTVRHGSPASVMLEVLPGTKIKQGGRHHGKIMAVSQAGQ